MFVWEIIDYSIDLYDILIYFLSLYIFLIVEITSLKMYEGEFFVVVNMGFKFPTVKK